jgi:long-chain alkane monooxygenase
MNTVSHIQHGQWRRPDAHQHDFNDVDVWIDLARTLEGAKFDAEASARRAAEAPFAAR